LEPLQGLARREAQGRPQGRVPEKVARQRPHPDAVDRRP
ncbi:hypothetical protein BN1723_021025, partial [Verticillium longisporum]